MALFNEESPLENLLEASNIKRTKTIVEIGQWEIDAPTQKVKYSRVFEEIFGLDFAGEPQPFSTISNVFHPDEREKVVQLYYESIEKKVPFDLTHRLKLGDGTIKHIHSTCANIFDNDGTHVSSIGTVREITAQVALEASLKTNQKNLLSIINELYERLMVVNLNYEITDVNLSFATEYNQSRDELIGKKCYEITHNLSEPCSGIDHICPLQVVLEKRALQTVKHIHINPVLGERVVEIHGLPLLNSENEIISMVEVINDITDYVAAERSAFIDAERARTLTRIANRFNTYLEMDAIAEAICEELAQALKVPYVVLQLNDLDANEFAYAGQFGFSLKDTSLMHDLCGYLENHHPFSGQIETINDIQKIAEQENLAPVRDANIQSVLAATIERNNILIGKVFLFIDDKEYQFDENDIKFIQGIINQAAIALENARLYQAERDSWQTSEALRRMSLDLTSTMALDQVLERMLVELQGVVSYDRATIQLLEEDKLKIVSEQGFPDAGKLIGATFSVRGGTGYTRVIETKKPFIRVFQSKKNDYEAGDSNSMISWLGAPLLFGDELIGLITLTKTSPRFYSEKHEANVMAFAASSAIAVQNARLFKNLQEQMRILRQTQDLLVQTEKLSALGKLITGIAHELNNPLATILLLAQQSHEEGDPEEIIDDLKKIAVEAKRTSRIVRDLQIFARHQKPARQLKDLNKVVKKAVSNFDSRFVSEGVEVNFALTGDMPDIYIDQGQIRQVIINLVENAIQAMRESSGKKILRIVTEVGWSTYGASPARSRVIRLKFEDTGPGIPPDVLPHIFEPFFSTKKIGEGTGLGLPISHGIISEHGGNIWAVSENGDGTTMMIELPVLPGGSIPEKYHPKPQPQKTQLAGLSGSTILLIDDEEKLLDILSKILKKRDFQVVTANNGENGAALALSTNPDVIVCDLLMPNMDGREVYYSIKKHAPELIDRMIFITGDSVSKESAEFLSEANVPALNKPFELEVFVEVVQQKLAAR